MLTSACRTLGVATRFHKMTFDFIGHHIPAISLTTDRGIEFLVARTLNLRPEDAEEAAQIRSYLSSFLPLPLVLASQQTSGEWLLFGDDQFVSAFRTDSLDHAAWVNYSLQKKTFDR
jgi:hypothetical protein